MARAFASQADMAEKKITFSRLSEHAYAFTAEGDPNTGIVEPGAFADLIVVDGNPLKKLELFLDQGAHLPMIMKGGKFHKNALK